MKGGKNVSDTHGRKSIFVSNATTEVVQLDFVGNRTPENSRILTFKLSIGDIDNIFER